MPPDKVRFVGEPVAMVVAETVDQAKDAAELLEIAYEPLPAVAVINAIVDALAELGVRHIETTIRRNLPGSSLPANLRQSGRQKPLLSRRAAHLP